MVPPKIGYVARQRPDRSAISARREPVSGCRCRRWPAWCRNGRRNRPPVRAGPAAGPVRPGRRAASAPARAGQPAGSPSPASSAMTARPAVSRRPSSAACGRRCSRFSRPVTVSRGSAPSGQAGCAVQATAKASKAASAGAGAGLAERGLVEGRVRRARRAPTGPPTAGTSGPSRPARPPRRRHRSRTAGPPRAPAAASRCRRWTRVVRKLPSPPSRVMVHSCTTLRASSSSQVSSASPALTRSVSMIADRASSGRTVQQVRPGPAAVQADQHVRAPAAPGGPARPAVRRPAPMTRPRCRRAPRSAGRSRAPRARRR